MFRKFRAAVKTNFAPIPAPRSHLKQNNKLEFTVNKVSSIGKRTILLPTSAVKVVSSNTGVIRVDISSLATLISDNLEK